MGHLLLVLYTYLFLGTRSKTITSERGTHLKRGTRVELELEVVLPMEGVTTTKRRGARSQGVEINTGINTG